MNRRRFSGVLLAGLFPVVALGQKMSGSKKKFYITGLAHTATANDCTIPPIVSYGTDRIDALANSGLTVWTEAEYEDMRRRIGKEFDESCKTLKDRQPDR